MSVSLFPYSQKEASNIVSGWQNDIGSELLLAKKHGDTTKTGALQVKYNFYYELLTDINLRRNNIVAASITIMILAPTYKELVIKSNYVKDILGATRAVTMYQKQTEGLIHTLPFMSNINEYHDVTVANATCLSPLISTDFTHPSGIWFGENTTGSPVFLDLFIGPPRLNGPHMFIVGMTRSGKSYALKGIVARSIAQGESVTIHDPEGEYRSLVQELGGVLVKFKPNMECMFNLFDIEPEFDEDRGIYYIDIAGKSEEISQIISSVIEFDSDEKVSAEEKSQISKVVRDEYFSKGITEDPNNLYQSEGKYTKEGVFIGKSYKELPTITSFSERCKEIGLMRIYNILPTYRKGGGLGFFDGQSIGSFYDSPLVVFDYRDLKTESQRIYAMMVMEAWTWEKFVKRDKKRKKVVSDENWIMMKKKQTATFMSDLSRRGAKYNVSLVFGSQSFREYLSEEGMVLLNQCDTKFFLKLKPTDAEKLGEIFKLPEGVVEKFESFQQGEGVLQVGRESAIVRFKGFPFEEHFLRSDPEAVIAR